MTIYFCYVLYLATKSFPCKPQSVFTFLLFTSFWRAVCFVKQRPFRRNVYISMFLHKFLTMFFPMFLPMFLPLFLLLFLSTYVLVFLTMLLPKFLPMFLLVFLAMFLTMFVRNLGTITLVFPHASISIYWADYFLCLQARLIGSSISTISWNELEHNTVTSTKAIPFWRIGHEHSYFCIYKVLFKVQIFNKETA